MKKKKTRIVIALIIVLVFIYVSAETCGVAALSSTNAAANGDEYNLQTAGKLNGIVLKALVTEVGVKFDYTPSNNRHGYRIYRSTQKGDRGISITDFPITKGKFVDVNVKENTTYYYTIRKIERVFNLDRKTGKYTDERLGPASEALTVFTGTMKPMPQKPTRNFILMEIDKDTMLVNQDRIPIDAEYGTMPRLIDNRTFVPIRAIINAIGGSIEWDEKAQKIYMSAYDYNINKTRNIIMTLGSNIINVDGEDQEMDVAPILENKRTLVPIRFVAENLGCLIQWTADNEIIIVFYSDADVSAANSN